MTARGDAKRFVHSLQGTLHVRWSVLLLGLLLLMLCFWFIVVDYTNDDAFISFRFARNLLDGYGLVFNPGERVEGYTNFSWTILIAGTMAIGLDPVLASRILGGVLGFATLLLVHRFGTQIAHRSPAKSAVAPLLLVFSVPFGIWTFSGLETPLFSFLALSGTYLFVLEWRDSSRFPLSAICFALAALTRPEGILFFGISLLARTSRFCFNRTDADQRQRLRFALWVVLFLVIFGLYYGWRFSYYGYPFPNTFYVRQPTSLAQYLSHWARGYTYVRDFVFANGGILFLLPAVLLLRQKVERWPLYVGALVLSWVVYLIYVGGDPKVFFRLVVLILPLVFLLVQEGFHELVDWMGTATDGKWTRWRIVALMLIAMIVTLDPVLIAGQAKKYVQEAKTIEPQRTAIGQWLRDNAHPDARLAVRAAGIVPYYSGLYTIDMLGVLDPTIAHQDILDADRATAHGKTDVAYILSLKPDYLLVQENETWSAFRSIDWAEHGYERILIKGTAAHGPHALWKRRAVQP